MRLCGNLAMFLLLGWLAPRDSEGREKGREGKKDEAENGVAFKGKFSGRARESCTWTVSGEQQYTLKVTCVVMKKGKPRRGYTCEYTAEPALCARFVSKPDAFWRQISRALKQHKLHLCRDARETIQARMCKSGPVGAHFRLVNPMKEITMTTPAVRAGLPKDTPTTECTPDHRQLAQEKCGNAWASICNLLFSIVESRDC
ncbi:fibroblast growth factor-binding protein 1 [Pangasianodon hypophthalmus]|uniref:fibroblast growth factor-binding protein 1 n=1 Tax=Pangasianodon hypophthalmus TaxID=310915 RepID=UPI00147DAFDC|nr:fibroblast growth factor-binding protein 1 [Pangasianodon hypophthalmus]